MALVKSTKEIIIYESPDGGKTVYGRKSGDPHDRRKQFSPPKTPERYLDAYDYLEACDLSKRSLIIKDALERLAVAYAITQKNDETRG